MSTCSTKVESGKSDNAHWAKHPWSPKDYTFLHESKKSAYLDLCVPKSELFLDGSSDSQLYTWLIKR